MVKKIHHGNVPEKIAWAIFFVVFSAVFGPLMLARPPDFSGWSNRQLVSIAIGLFAWAVVINSLLGGVV